ncbi:MAG: hypothetical protein ACLFWM_08850 [Actinomycetota bacterium]
MTTPLETRERILLVVDPVSCGETALERALAGLDPDRHALTLLVVAKAPPSGDATLMPVSGFAHAQASLAVYRRVAEEAGFPLDGWVTPDRPQQIAREVEASGPYDRALAVSPSGVRRRLLRQDLSRLLETIGIDTALACAR